MVFYFPGWWYRVSSLWTRFSASDKTGLSCKLSEWQEWHSEGGNGHIKQEAVSLWELLELLLLLWKRLQLHHRSAPEDITRASHQDISQVFMIMIHTYGLLFNSWNILGSIDNNGVLQCGQPLYSICSSPIDGVGHDIPNIILNFGHLCNSLRTYFAISSAHHHLLIRVASDGARPWWARKLADLFWSF